MSSENNKSTEAKDPRAVLPPKPARLPSSFRPSPVAWQKVTLSAPWRGGTYVPNALEKILAAPRANNRPKPPRTAPGTGEIEVRPSSTRVLLLERDEPTADQLESALREWGFDLTVAGDSGEAVAMLERGEIPHVLVVGAGGPLGQPSGLEVARRFAAAAPEIETVLVAGASELALALEVKGTRVHEMILKPILRLEELRGAMANACHRLHSRLFSNFLASEFDRYHRQMEIEARLSAELSEQVELSRVVDAISRGVAELFDDGYAIFLQYQASQRALAAVTRFPRELFAGGMPKLMLPKGVGTKLESAREFLANLANEPEFQRLMAQAGEMSPELMSSFKSSWHTVLVETRGIPRGVIAVYPRNWNERTDPMRLQRLACNLAKSYEIALLHSRLQESSIQDTVTGLSNNRYFKARLNEEVQKASRLRHPLSLLIVERAAASSEKGANSKPIKDRALKQLAAAVQSNFRSTDLRAYRGGDQFGVVLPHTSFVDALKKAEKFRLDLEARNGGAWKVGVGLAEYPGHAASAEELLFAAESACSAAASEGGASVRIAEARPGYVPPYRPVSPRSASVSGAPSKT